MATFCIVTNSKYNTHTDHIFVSNKQLKLNDIIKFHMCEFGYKLNCKIHPHRSLIIFAKNQEIGELQVHKTYHFFISKTCS